MRAFGALFVTSGGSMCATALGVCVLLSISLLDPSDSAGILRRQAGGCLFLVLPAIAQKYLSQQGEH